MDTEVAKSAIEVMQHHVNGGAIEVYDCKDKVWRVLQNPSWDWVNFVYRIKPERAIVKAIRDRHGHLHFENFNSINKILVEEYDRDCPFGAPHEVIILDEVIKD